MNVGQELKVLMTKLVGRLLLLGFNTAIDGMYTAVDSTIDSCLAINMLDVNEPLLSRMGLAEFEAMKKLGLAK